MGRPAFQRYQAGGGICFHDIGNLFRDRSLERLLPDIVRITAFNVIIGNGDAQAKNFSLMHSKDGTVLAPFYDLCSITGHNISVGPYRDSGITFDDSFAFTIGKAKTIKSLRDRDIAKFAHTMCPLDEDDEDAEENVRKTFCDMAATLAEKCDDVIRNILDDIARLDLDDERRMYSKKLCASIHAAITQNIDLLRKNTTLPL